MSSWTAGYVTDLGYTHGYYRELMPTTLALAALAAGHRAPDPSGPLTYCELGTGQGFSANVLAAANPHVEVYANDFNPGQTAGAQRLAKDAGLTNIHFSDQSFEDRLNDDSLPDFDIIALHGIYSWINAEDRSRIAQFIRRRLKPGGLAYVSYNTPPGWAAAAPIRHLLYLHAQSSSGPTGARIEPAFAFVDRLSELGANYFKANPQAKTRFDKVKGQARSYVAHEYLNESWNLLYHSEVAAEMEVAKLSFIASAALLDHIDTINITPDQQQLLAGIAESPLRQTTRDYIVGQAFRRDVFAKGPQQLTFHEAQAQWTDTRFALTVNRADVILKVTGALGEAELQADVYTPILDAFATGPKTVRQLVTDATILGLGWSRLQQALGVLVGVGHLSPCLEAKGDSKRGQRTTAFNNAVIARAQYTADLHHLASPVTGGAIGVDRIAQLMLLAHQQKQADPAQFVWNILKPQGVQLIKEGKTIEGDKESLELLKVRQEEFKTKHLPVMQQLGIA